MRLGGTSPRNPRVGQVKPMAEPLKPAATHSGHTVGRKSI